MNYLKYTQPLSSSPPARVPARSVSKQLFEDRIFVHQNNQMLRIMLRDIRYIAAERAYCTIYTTTGKHTLSVSLGRLERQLPTGRLLRVHRSYIVNPAAISAIDNGTITVGDRCLPVSKTRREELLSAVCMIC